MNKQAIKDMLYDIQNEFDNEIDDYVSEIKDVLTSEDLKLMSEYLYRFVCKCNIVIDYYEESEEDL